MKRSITLMCRSLSFAALIALPGAALAAKAETKPAQVAATDFARTRAQIEADLASGEKYRELSQSDRAEVLASLDEMEELLEGVDSVQALGADERARLLNAQEKVNTLLTAAHDDSRMECKRIKKVGTRLPTTVCNTVAEWRRQQDLAREASLRARGARGEL